MRSITQSRVASILTLLLGAWLLVSPLIISTTGGALASLLAVGGVMTVAGFVQLFWGNSLPSWLAAVTMIYLFVSAFTFTIGTAATWNEVLASLAGLLLTSWDGVETYDAYQLHHGAL
ncbi:MAG TPA: hypothetical protein VLF69_03250 [Candidatus Saccharimonadales bacterium]|nr:hypothetical protein [Candidatus Saccharimonadales bacterium]